MAKDKSVAKKEKKEKRASKDGVHKQHHHHKDKKTKISKLVEGPLTERLLSELEKGKPDVDKQKQLPAEPNVAEAMEVEVTAAATERPIGALVPFANPLADDKIEKKVFKGVKKAVKHKALKRGVKEVVKCLRKSPLASANTSPLPTGVVVLAADISPWDVISHIPVLCEDHGIPYIYVTSRAELGASSSTKRPTSVVMVTLQKNGGKSKKSGDDKDSEDDYKEAYESLAKIIEKEYAKVKI